MKYINFLFIVLFIFNDVNADICQTNDNNDAIIVALLPIHDGISCNSLRLKSIQQSTAAQLAIKNIPKEDDGFSIGLQIIDTCSDVKRAVRMAFKTIVLMDPSICKNAPLFLGFLGPDTYYELKEVLRVTGVFHVTHVLPKEISKLKNSDIFNVVKENTNLKQKIITNLLKKLEWTTISIIYTEEEENIVNNIITTSQRSMLCIKEHKKITNSYICNNLTADGIVIFISSNLFDQVIECIRSNSDHHTYIFIINDIDVLVKLYTINDLANTIIIIQEINNDNINKFNEELTNNLLWNKFIEEQNDLCSENCNITNIINVQDSSLVSITNAIRLYSKALKIAHKMKCSTNKCKELNNLTSDEWNNILSSVSDKGIRFNMEAKMSYNIYVKLPFVYDIEKVGNISENGRKIIINEEIKLPVSNSNGCKNSHFSTILTSSIITTTTNSPKLIEDNEEEEEISKFSISLFNRNDINLFDLSTYNIGELIIVLIGVAIVISFIMALLIYIIYSNFKVKGNNEKSRDAPSSRRSSINSN